MVKIYELTNEAYNEVKEILGDRVFDVQAYDGLGAWYVTLNDNVILKYSNRNLTLDLGGKKAMIENHEFHRVLIF